MIFLSHDLYIYLNIIKRDKTMNTTSTTTPTKNETVVPVTKKSSNSQFYRRNGDMVWRLFYDDSTFDRDGRYRCVAYCHNDKDGLTEYGGAVYKKDEGRTFDKRRIRRELSHTARERFEKRPVRLVISETKNRSDLHKRLTKAMFKFGVGSTRVPDDEEKVEIHGSI